MIGSVNGNKIQRIKNCIKLVKEQNLEGAILEFGVFQGYSLSEMALYCRQNNINYPIYGFDGFLGMPATEHHWPIGDGYSSLQNTTNELTGKLGNLNGVTLIPGLFAYSLTKELQKTLPKAALVHIDCDLYRSTSEALAFCEPLLQVGTYVIFDEYVNPDCPGESKAWKEFLDRTGFVAEDTGVLMDQVAFRITGESKNKQLINMYKNESVKAFDSVSLDKISQFIDLVIEAYQQEKTVFVAANGGGAAYVQNLVVDLNFHPFVSDNKDSQSVKRNKFNCVSLCSDQATLTGISNDLGFEHIFSQQLGFQGNPGDLVVGMSGSGNSKNILELFKKSKEKGMKNILFTRNKTNKCSEYSDLVICVDGISEFPGQIGGNNMNFHFEDLLSKISHIAVGVLKKKVQDETRS